MSGDPPKSYRRQVGRVAASVEFYIDRRARIEAYSEDSRISGEINIDALPVLVQILCDVLKDRGVRLSDIFPNTSSEVRVVIQSSQASFERNEPGRSFGSPDEPKPGKRNLDEID
jgi:hypothetical protein